MINGMNKKTKKILIVDDDIDLLEQMRIYIHSLGYDVTTAEGQNEALKILQETKPDLVVLDVMMEYMDSGFIVSHRIKKMDPTIKVILVTAIANETGLFQQLDSHDKKDWIKADAVIQKDIRFEQIKSQIERLLEE